MQKSKTSVSVVFFRQWIIIVLVKESLHFFSSAPENKVKLSNCTFASENFSNIKRQVEDIFHFFRMPSTREFFFVFLNSRHLISINCALCFKSCVIPSTFFLIIVSFFRHKTLARHASQAREIQSGSLVKAEKRR